jgi:predicted transcriptional regulator
VFRIDSHRYNFPFNPLGKFLNMDQFSNSLNIEVLIKTGLIATEIRPAGGRSEKVEQSKVES